MLLNSYSDVFSLNEAQLRALLIDGDDPVKVWASWALGVKLKNATIATGIQIRIGEEPSAGVRQNLLVFLAGNGEHDLLQWYASVDPNARVRAAACNLLARVAENIRDQNNLLDKLLLSDSASEVRTAILDSAARDKRIIETGVLHQIVLGEDQVLQSKALDVISAIAERCDEPSELFADLVDWFQSVQFDNYEKYCTLCYSLFESKVLLRLAMNRLDLAVIPLGILDRNGFRADWRQLNELAKTSDAGIVSLALSLLGDEANAGTVVWLLEILNLSFTGEKLHDSDWTTVRIEAMPKLYSILCKPINPRYTAYALPVLSMLRDELSYLRSPDLDDSWDKQNIESKVEYYEGFVSKLETWS